MWTRGRALKERAGGEGRGNPEESWERESIWWWKGNNNKKVSWLGGIQELNPARAQEEGSPTDRARLHQSMFRSGLSFLAPSPCRVLQSVNLNGPLNRGVRLKVCGPISTCPVAVSGEFLQRERGSALGSGLLSAIDLSQASLCVCNAGKLTVSNSNECV